jgi:adenylylsulfate kinase
MEKRKENRALAGIAIWITGLPGSGKSTVANDLKSHFPEFRILRMDELRSVLTPEPTYSDTERDVVYRALVYMAKKITDLGHAVIIDATGNLRKWRDLARELIPKYIEVYLKCPIEVCMQREKLREITHEAPRDIYRKGSEGWPVPGLTAPYEEPLAPEIVIDSDRTSLVETVERIAREISELKT